MNTILLLSRRDMKVRAWSSSNRRDATEWSPDHIQIERHPFPGESVSLPKRMPGYLAWHMRTAREIARWHPHVLISVEPHSALAVWMYYKLFRGSAPLFIHHHEYYAPEDFGAAGMRVLRLVAPLERKNLFGRAVWVSQTNDERLALLRSWNPQIRSTAARVFPNYPPEDWIARARSHARDSRDSRDSRLKLVYVGSASFEDTFIREIAEWVSQRRDRVTLSVAGNNVSPAVWQWLSELGASNIDRNERGVPYENLPGYLANFDMGLVLYKGNTQNFVHNIPNKAIEYLACRLGVLYPPQMTAMKNFHERFPELPLQQVRFDSIPDGIKPADASDDSATFQFSLERAAEPLIAELERYRPR
jgi:hypothetical protein